MGGGGGGFGQTGLRLLKVTAMQGHLVATNNLIKPLVT